jgi:glucosamine--fructose-6-phosphate aminotransferase (isomerizing)
VNEFRAEIRQQPEAAERLLGAAPGALKQAAAALLRHRPAGMVIAARGSSDHAATYAKYLFEIRNSIPVALAAPSAFTLYRRPPALRRFGVLAISQSGSSEDVVEVVAEARRQGAPTVVITNDPDSRLAAEAEHVLDLAAGRERSVPASKTYTTSLLMLAMLSQAMHPDLELAAALDTVPPAIERVLRLEPQLEQAGQLLSGPRLAVLGRGFNLATAQEVALKVMETCSVVAESRSVADFLHGPIAVVGPGFPALLIEAAGPTLGDMQALAGRLTELGARVVMLTDRAGGDDNSETVVRVRTGLPEVLTPIPFAVAGQLLALRMAVRLGVDPARPRGLRKVTVTR